MAACVRFEGEIQDESPSKQSLLRADNVTYRAGPDGLAVSLSSASRLRLAATSTLYAAHLSIDVWINPRTQPTGSARAGIIDHEGYFGLFLLPGGRIHCIVGDSDLEASDSVETGQWSSLACTSDGSTLQLWHDGLLVGQRAVVPPSTSGPAELVIGGNFESASAPNPDPFDGLVDNLRIWRRVRTAEEICQAAAVCRH